mmetsp:Transcript_59561/g.184817  ORF Transcript_59561/g.184817 Transcript_59561/m.184817 type:complete len:212 (-) Transcript_59561:99-734(-)
MHACVCALPAGRRPHRRHPSAALVALDLAALGLLIEALALLLLLDHRLELRQEQHRSKGEEADEGHGALEDGQDVEFLALLEVGVGARGREAQRVLQLGAPAVLKVGEVGRHLHGGALLRLHAHWVEDEPWVHNLQEVRPWGHVADDEVAVRGGQRRLHAAVEDDPHGGDPLARREVVRELLRHAHAAADLAQLLLRPRGDREEATEEGPE